MQIQRIDGEIEANIEAIEKKREQQRKAVEDKASMEALKLEGNGQASDVDRVMMENGQQASAKMGTADLPDYPDMPQEAAPETETIQNEYEMVETRIMGEFCRHLANEAR